MGNEQNGDGRHIPLNSYTAEDQILISRSDAQPEAMDATAFVTEYGGGGGGGGGSALAGDTVIISTNTVDAGSGADDHVVFTQITHSDQQKSEVGGVPTWIALDNDKLIFESGTYMLSFSVRGDVGAGEQSGSIRVIPQRTGSGPQTGFTTFCIAGGDNAPGLNPGTFAINDNYARGVTTWLVSVPAALAHRTMFIRAFASVDTESWSGSINIEEFRITKLA